MNNLSDTDMELLFFAIDYAMENLAELGPPLLPFVLAKENNQTEPSIHRFASDLIEEDELDSIDLGQSVEMANHHFATQDKTNLAVLVYDGTLSFEEDQSAVIAELKAPNKSIVTFFQRYDHESNPVGNICQIES